MKSKNSRVSKHVNIQTCICVKYILICVDVLYIFNPYDNRIFDQVNSITHILIHLRQKDNSDKTQE